MEPFVEVLQQDFASVLEPDTIPITVRGRAQLDKHDFLAHPDAQFLLQVLRNILDPQARPWRIQTAATLSVRSGGGLSQAFSTDHHDLPAVASANGGWPCPVRPATQARWSSSETGT